MTPEEILAEPARVLSQAQREHYFEKGFVGAEGLLPADVLAELIRVTDDFVEASKAETQSGKVFDIGPGHGPDTPASVAHSSWAPMANPNPAAPTAKRRSSCS